MSPSAAAPSMASVTAWHTMSASEWPSRPRSNGIVTPGQNQRPALDQAMQVVPGADAHGACVVLSGECAGAHEILGGRHLDVGGVALDQMHLKPARSTSMASSVTEGRPAAAMASASTSRRNACGVCARKIDSRGSVAAIDRVARHRLPA